MSDKTVFGFHISAKVPRIVWRDQFDGLGDQISEETGVVFDSTQDITRQEYKKETEVDFILQRYGLPTPTGRFGEYDSTVDLQEAIRLQGELAAAFDRLPEKLRQQYGSWAAIIEAADRGVLSPEDLKHVDEQQNEALDKRPQPSESPSEGVSQ